MVVFFDDLFIDSTKIVSNGSIQISNNEIVVVHGENGSGKTLLVKNIFQNKKNKQIRIVFVDQNNDAIVKHWDVIHNITMSTDKNINEKAKLNICKWGLEEILNRDTSKLSGGEKRIISILRGLLSDAELVILDEPTNDLDYLFVQKFIEIVQQMRTLKKMIIVSHDDRIDAIANKQYRIINHVLRLQSQRNFNAMINLDKLQTGNKLDLFILDRLFVYNFIPLIMGIIFLCISFLQMIAFHKDATRTYDKIPNNQINVYIPVSITMNDGSVLKGYPAVAVKNIDEINPIKQLSLLNELDRIMKEKYSDLTGLDKLESNDMITVYPLEFFNPQNKSYTFTVDCYLRKYHKTTQDTAVLNTSDYFEQPFLVAYEKRGEYRLDIEKFNVLVNELKTNSSGHLVAATIVLNDGYSMSDFYNSDICNSLAGSNVYMASNEISDYVITIMTLQRLLKKTGILFIACCFLLLAIFLTDIMFCRTQLSNFMIAKNYGFQFENIIDSVLKRCNQRVPYLMALLTLIFVNVFLFWGHGFHQINYYYSFCATIFMTVAYQFNNMILTRYFKNAFRWNTR